jgi:hypothetical protein
MDDCLNIFRFCKLKVTIEKDSKKDKNLSNSISDQIKKLFGKIYKLF